MIIFSNYALAQIKDIKLLEIVFMDNINYYSFYHKNTIIHDQIDTSKNISIITTYPDLKRITKNNTIRILPNEIIVSHDIIYPYDILKDYQINPEIKESFKNYFENKKIVKKLLKKRGKYELLNVEEKNSIILVLELSVEYFNEYSHNLKITTENNKKIKVYKILNGLDEDLIRNSENIAKYFKIYQKHYEKNKNYLGGFKFVVYFKLCKSAECQQTSKNKNRKIS